MSQPSRDLGDTFFFVFKDLKNGSRFGFVTAAAAARRGEKSGDKLVLPAQPITECTARTAAVTGSFPPRKQMIFYFFKQKGRNSTHITTFKVSL